MIRVAFLRAAALLVLLPPLLSCGGGDSSRPEGPSTPPPSGDLVPDFRLADVNPKSATSGQIVSPRQFLQRTSAWYFGHAT